MSNILAPSRPAYRAASLRQWLRLNLLRWRGNVWQALPSSPVQRHLAPGTTPTSWAAVLHRAGNSQG